MSSYGIANAIGFNTSSQIFKTPEDISDLKLWYRASDLILNDNDLVQTWYDFSGNDFDAIQNTSANRPTYRTDQINGKPALVFDGVSDKLDLSGAALGILRNVSGVTVFLIAKYSTGTASSQNSLTISTGTSNANPRIRLLKNTSEKFSVVGRRLDDNANLSVTSTLDNVGNFIIHSSRINFQNTLQQQFLNGIKYGERTNFQTSGNTSDTDSVAIAIGHSGASSLFLVGSLSEVIVYNRSLNDSELFQIHSYLKKEYNL